MIVDLLYCVFDDVDGEDDEGEYIDFVVVE